MTRDDVLEEFMEVQSLRGYKRPKLLNEIELESTDDERDYDEESTCPVDIFLKKNKGLR